jgi:hypothetical protein
VHGVATAGETANETINVCVPARGFASVRVTTPLSALIPGDQRSQYASTITRTGGLLVSGIALGDEIGSPCNPRAG